MRGQEGPRTDRKKNEVFISFLLHALQHARSRRTTLNGPGMHTIELVHHNRNAHHKLINFT